METQNPPANPASPLAAMNIVPSQGFLAIIAGKSNSGKSHFIRWFFSELRNHFDYGLVFSNTSFEGAYEFLPDDYIYPEFNPAVIENLIQIQTKMILAADKKAKKKSLDDSRRIAMRKRAFVLLDDCCSDREFDSPIMKKLAVQGRHYSITTILSTQYIHLCPPVLRANCNYGLFFDIGDGRHEIEATFNWIGGRFKSLQEFKEFYYANTEDHKFILYHRDDREYKVFRAPAEIPSFALDFRAGC